MHMYIHTLTYTLGGGAQHHGDHGGNHAAQPHGASLDAAIVWRGHAATTRRSHTAHLTMQPLCGAAMRPIGAATQRNHGAPESAAMVQLLRSAANLRCASWRSHTAHP